MEAKLEPQAQSYYRGRPVSALGLRVRKMREQIEASAARGETTLLNKEELDHLIEEMRPSDPDLFDAGVLISASRGDQTDSGQALRIIEAHQRKLLTSVFVRLEVYPRLIGDGPLQRAWLNEFFMDPTLEPKSGSSRGRLGAGIVDLESVSQASREK